MTLQDAIVEADPVPNMIPFYRALQSRVPESEQFILSARMRSMRLDTLAWLDRHGLAPSDGTVCFVPDPAMKPRVWQQLARGSRLVIVDDLSYGHEDESTRTYDDLVNSARRTASVYIGVRDIERIAANPEAVDEVAAWTVALLGAPTVDARHR